jgi:tetratricopeptide (TPR) repeat protein
VAYSSEIDKLRARYNENPKGRNFAPLADAYRKARQLDEAIALCREGLQHHPDYVSAHIVLGRCLIDKKDDVAAEASFRRVLELDQENIIALKMLSDIAMRSGRAYEAVHWLTRLLQVDPMNGEAAEALSAARGQLAAPPVPLSLEQAEAVEFAAPETAPPIATTLAELPAAMPPVDAPAGASVPPPLAMTEAPTEALVQPDFSLSAPMPPPPAGDGGLETYDGTIDFSEVEREAVPLEGVARDEPEIAISGRDVTPTEGLARTQYEGSGMFKLNQPPPAEEPAVSGLPLIMPEEEEPAPAPRPTEPEHAAPPPARMPTPAIPMFSDDEGAADQSALSAAEPLVTETMAELYLQQGHVEDALRVYRALLESRPGDGDLQAKVDQLSAPRSEPPPAPAPPAQTAVEFLRRVFQGTPGAPPVAPAATETARAATVLDDVFGGMDEPEEPGEPAVASGVAGAPTKPASDALSLDRVFGEVGTDRVTPAAKGAAVGATTGFSFDEFFSAPQPPPVEASGEPGSEAAASPRPAKAGEPEQDLDQFQAWLRSLKA